MKSSLLQYYKNKYGSGGKKVPVLSTGMWYQDGDVVVPSDEITTKGPNGEKDFFEVPILAIGLDSGEAKVMEPGNDYSFPNDTAVYETKMQQGGIKDFPPRTLAPIIPQFIPGISDISDFTDIMQGAVTGNRNQMNQGIIGLASSDIAGKGLPMFLDYITEKTLSKDIADANESKREDIVNMSTSDLQKLYKKYGPGGYDKWKNAGFPKLQKGGKFPNLDARLDNVSRQGDFDYSASVDLGPFRGQTGLHMGKYDTVQDAENASALRTAKYNMLQDPVRFKMSDYVPNMQDGGQQSYPLPNFDDNVIYLIDKILQYEQARGGPGGVALPQYKDPIYREMLINDIFPKVKQIMPNASALELGEAIDFVFNAGWDKENKQILKDPRAYALQEYYKQYDKSKLDQQGDWPGRKQPVNNDIYNSTIGKLSENERRILMNRGRDWYYQHINNPSAGVLSPDYEATWYGRIHNTNDYSPFNPNNPNFIRKKKIGGLVNSYQDGGTVQTNKQGMQSGGFSYTPPSRRAFTTSYPQPVRSTSDNARVVTHNTNVSDASRTKIMAQRAEEQRRKEQEARRKAQEPIRSTSDNTRLVTANTNVSDATRAMIDDQRAKEAAAKRSGVIYATPEESNYEKAKKAASFVEQSKLSDGFATPLDYVLDVVNPAQYVFGAGDLAKNQFSMMKNVAQGNFSEALSDYQEAQMNALTLAPVSKYLGPVLKGAAKSAAKPFLKYADDVVYPRRAYRVEAVGGNKIGYTPSALADKVAKKGDWATTSLPDVSRYAETRGMLDNIDINFTEYKLPFWKKNIASDADVVKLKLNQGFSPSELVKSNEYLVPKNKFLYPRKTTTLKAAPSHLFDDPLYYKGVSAPESLRYGSSPLKYLEDQINAVTGQNMPLTFDVVKEGQYYKIPDRAPIRDWTPKMKMGGMSIPGVNGTVVASPTSLKEAYMKKGGQHGGLDRWFAEKWVDVKSGKPCGRQEGESRAYPACRPSKRVSSKTPKTSSEMSSKEKAKFKASKTSSQRIPYNHKRNK